MRIKAIKDFVSGRYRATAGETVEVSDNRGELLVHLGLAKHDPAGGASQEQPKKANGKKKS